MKYILTRRIWPHRLLLVLLSGLLLYVGSYIITIPAVPRIIIDFLRDLGIALVISTVAVYMVERLVHESLLRNVNEAVDTLRKGSDVLEGAADLGIEDILARREKTSRERWREKIKNAIEKQINKGSGEVRIACVAAPGFFRSGTDIGTILWEGLVDQQSNCRLRVLLLSADSEWGELRARLEPGHPTVTDIRASIGFLKHLKSSEGNVEFKCYDFPAIAFLILTDEYVFIEAYPMVEVEVGEGPIGGVSPMVIARNDTKIYECWKGHFEFIWEEKSEDCGDGAAD